MLKFFWLVSLERRLGDPGWYDVLAPPVKQMRRDRRRRSWVCFKAGPWLLTEAGYAGLLVPRLLPLPVPGRGFHH